MCDYIYKKKDDGNLQGVYVLLKTTNLLNYHPHVDSPFTEYKVKIGMAYADAAKRAKQQEFLSSRQANLTVNGISKTVRLYDNIDVIQIRRCCGSYRSPARRRNRLRSPCAPSSGRKG